MLALLNEADSLNRAYAQLPSDTLLHEAADFFDRHGSANEQVRAHYLLGCAYRDQGDAPRSIECFLDAAAKADTSATDCDYRLLGTVCSQMANMYYKQLLLAEEIDSRKKAYNYICISGDTSSALGDLKLMAGTYIVLDKLDSAEYLLHKVMDYYRDHGETQKELQSSILLMHIYERQILRTPELGELVYWLYHISSL